MNLEFDRLAYCCGLARGIPVANTISQPEFRAGLDEDSFIELARQHKVSGTVYSGLKKSRLTLSPGGMSTLARDALIGRSTRSLILQDCLKTAAAFQAQKIRMLVIKGPALSNQLYGDPLTREFTDLDILADISDIRMVLPLMIELGYEAADASALPHTDSGSPFSQNNRLHHVSFQKSDLPIRIEIHGKTWQEDKEFSPELVEAFFDRSVPFGDGEGWGRTLCPADQALLIIAHGTQHAWCLLHWLLDLAIVLQKRDEALHRTLADRIRALGMSRKLKLACAVVRSLYPVIIPKPLQAIIDHETASLARSQRFALESLRSGGKKHTSFRNIILHNTVFSPSMTKDLSGKLQFIIGLFLTPQKDIDILPLPRPLHFLFLPLRPVFVLARRWRRRFGRENDRAA